MPKSLSDRIDFLDFMRIFAFLSVLVGHKFFPQLQALANDEGSHITIRYIAGSLMPLCRGGAAGVIVFFFTSGYIITHVLRKETSPEFLVKRFFRIYPLYMFAVLAEMLAGAAWGNLQPSPWSVLIPRLLLLGDFFHTPYALAGVEWTLRVEVVFYALMAVLKAVGALDRPRWLPAVFVLFTALLHRIGPFPNVASWSEGYLTVYGPFLFIGSIIYLGEKGLASRKLCVVAGALIMAAHLTLIAEIQPGWKNSNYALFALLLFLGAWRFRERFFADRLVQVLSNLTYAVYLFHNWLWSYLYAAVVRVGVVAVPVGLQVLAALLLVCYLAHWAVERNGIRIGRHLLARYRTRKTAMDPCAPSADRPA